MRIATWNVNSIRARFGRLAAWLSERSPDVVCLQETKVEDAKFPQSELEDLGYQVTFYGQKTYNGVAILSKQRLEDVVRGLPGDGPEAQKRVLGATVADCLILNLYVVNGEAVGSEKYAYKLAWLARLADFVEQHYDMREKVILAGDFNVTFDDRDVYDPDLWREKVLCSTPEREALRRLLKAGFVDAFRHLDERPGQYTWWDFRTRGYQRKQGLRIDHFLMSPPALAACRSVEIDLSAREGEKPSDHAPVIAALED